MTTPFPDAPTFLVDSRDGTRIAVFSAGNGPAVPVLLVHGTGSDHTTWRAVAPRLTGERHVHALDRRGRGGSEDTLPYAAGREAEDIAAVAGRLADRHGGPIAVAGHSLGGRLALAAALRTDAIARVLAYEGAPGSPADPAARTEEALLATLRSLLDQGQIDALLETFLRVAGGLPAEELAAFRASDLWPRRAATAPLIVRELGAALGDDAIALDALARVTQPVLQLTGTRSPGRFHEGAAALDARLPHGRIESIEGARHNAHHSHPDAFAVTLRRFVDGR